MPDSVLDPDLREQFAAERDRLLEFGRRAGTAVGGFGRLDQQGRRDPDAPVLTFQTCRMVYGFVLATLSGHADRPLVRAGLAALAGELHDASHGGWFASLRPDGTALDTGKQAYAHAFVLLAAAAGTALDEPAAHGVLDAVLAVIDEHFWDDDAGVMRESFDADWRNGEPYRGANANMHSVEALLAAADATGERTLLQRADRIATCFIDGSARAHAWRLPEHYSPELAVLPEYNRAQPMHPFRPFGVTPGHLFEWSRLCIQLAASLTAAGLAAPWHLGAARSLYRRAVADGWAVDGRPGFVYTVDFAGVPVARARMSWVLAEAMGAAAALYTTTGDEQYTLDLRRWWAEASARFIDRVDGSWHPALDETNQPRPAGWGGKPDLYHALQAVMLPGQPTAPSLPFALSRR